MKGNQILGTIVISAGIVAMLYNLANSVSATTSIHQIYFAVKYCGEWLMIIAGVLIYNIKGDKK